MEVWIDEKRPDVMSTANVVLALVIHVACFLGFFLFARLHFKQKETVIPIDLTVVVNENLDGNEDEPPPLDDPPPKPPEPPKVVTPPPPPPKVDTKVDAVVKEPEKPKPPEKPKETLEERLKRMRELVKPKEPEKPKKEEPKKPEKTKEELLKERMEQMVKSAKTVKIQVPDKPSGNGKTAKQTMTEDQIRKLLSQGYTPGKTTQLATSTMQLCLSRIQMAINARWSQVNPCIGAEVESLCNPKRVMFSSPFDSTRRDRWSTVALANRAATRLPIPPRSPLCARSPRLRGSTRSSCASSASRTS